MMKSRTRSVLLISLTGALLMNSPSESAEPSASRVDPNALATGGVSLRDGSTSNILFEVGSLGFSQRSGFGLSRAFDNADDVFQSRSALHWIRVGMSSVMGIDAGSPDPTGETA